MNNAVKIFAYEKVTTWLLGGELFDFIKEEVAIMVDVDIEGSEKRKAVIEAAKEFFGEVIEIFVAIGVEVAYMIVKQKAGELKPTVPDSSVTVKED